MPTQNVNLSSHLADFVHDRVASGRFQNASEVVRAGLRLLEQHEAENELKLAALRSAVDEGFAAIESGDFRVISPESLDSLMNDVSATTGD